MAIPYWTSHDGRHVLYHGNCLDILPTLGKVDCVVTDPPYGINLGKTSGLGDGGGLILDAYDEYEDSYQNFVDVIVPRINFSLDLATRALVWTGPHIHEQRKPSVIGGVYLPAGAGRHNWGFKTFLPFLLYGSAPDIHLGAPYPSTRMDSERSVANGHPCPKPIGWMVWNVNLASRKNETVLDPFTGSGTTGVACIRTGRKFIGIEISKDYCDIAVKRMEAELAQGNLFEVEKPNQRTAQTGMVIDG